MKMTCYSVQSRDQIFVKAYGFLSFPKNMGKNIGKNISKNISSKYSQKLFDHAKRSAADALKTPSKRVVQKTAEATSDLIGNKIPDKITRVSKTSPLNNSETNEEEILRDHLHLHSTFHLHSRKRSWVEITDESKGRYYNSNIRFKKSMIRSSLCDYSNPRILVKGTITVPNTTAAGVAVNNTNKKVIFKNCAPFTDCITEINNIQVDDAQKTDTVMPMYNLIEYSDAYLKKSGSF